METTAAKKERQDPAPSRLESLFSLAACAPKAAEKPVKHCLFQPPTGCQSSQKLATGFQTSWSQINIWETSGLGPKTWWSAVYSYRARWYLPESGVFGERDPFEFIDSPDLYQFVGYNPNNTRDPMGSLNRGGLEWRANTWDENRAFWTVGFNVEAWGVYTDFFGDPMMRKPAALEGAGIHLGVNWQFWRKKNGNILAVWFAYDNLTAEQNTELNTGWTGLFGSWGLLGEGASIGASMNVAYYIGPGKNGYLDLEEGNIIREWAGRFYSIDIAAPGISGGYFWSEYYRGVEGSGGPLGIGLGARVSILDYRATTLAAEFGRIRSYIIKTMQPAVNRGIRLVENAKVRVLEKVDGAKRMFERLIHPTWKRF